MRILIFAVGRMKKSAEQELGQRYLSRFAKMAPSVGLGLEPVIEIVESRAATIEQRTKQEGNKLMEKRLPATRLVLLDEGGRQLSSPQFASILGGWRDDGIKTVIFALGSADGHGAYVRQHADFLLSLGAMTWPHQLARILLAEQLYRAATILANHPYHHSGQD